MRTQVLVRYQGKRTLLRCPYVFLSGYRFREAKLDDTSMIDPCRHSQISQHTYAVADGLELRLGRAQAKALFVRRGDFLFFPQLTMAAARSFQESVSALASVESGCKPRCLSFSRKVNRDSPNQRGNGLLKASRCR